MAQESAEKAWCLQRLSFCDDDGDFVSITTDADILNAVSWAKKRGESKLTVQTSFLSKTRSEIVSPYRMIGLSLILGEYDSSRTLAIPQDAHSRI